MSSPLVFPKLRGTRVSDEIAALIRSEVEVGKLKVGSRLPPERVLADQFGVSRNSLREALRSLENAGLLRLEKGVNGGAVVQDRSGEAIVLAMLDMYHLGGINPDDLTQARILCEADIIRLACAAATPEDIAALNANIDAAEAAGESGKPTVRIKLHLEFHRLLAQMTGNPILVVVMDGMLEILIKFLRTIGPYDGSFVTPSRRRFMVHFKAGRADEAVAEMESLLRKLEEQYLSLVKVAKVL